MHRINVLGIHITSLSIDELHTYLASTIESGGRALILNVNVNGMNLAYEHPWLHSFLNSAEMVFCDGAGVVMGARVLGYRVSRRITYADWMWQLAEFAEPRGYTLFFLGARAGVADRAAANLKDRFPELRLVGTHHGYFDKAPGSPENQAVVRRINTVKPNMLIVGFGMPLQELWLRQNWGLIEANVGLTGGAVFDYVSGELRRPPRWMVERGLEWLGRLIIEPRRLWRRYLIGNPLFLWRVLKQRYDWLKRVDPSSYENPL